MLKHPSCNAPDDSRRFIKIEIMTAFSMHQAEDLFQCTIVNFSVVQNMNRKFLYVVENLLWHKVGRKHVICIARTNGTIWHPIKLCTCGLLHNNQSARFLDCFGSSCPVATRSR